MYINPLSCYRSSQTCSLCQSPNPPLTLSSGLLDLQPNSPATLCTTCQNPFVLLSPVSPTFLCLFLCGSISCDSTSMSFHILYPVVLILWDQPRYILCSSSLVFLWSWWIPGYTLCVCNSVRASTSRPDCDYRAVIKLD